MENRPCIMKYGIWEQWVGGAQKAEALNMRTVRGMENERENTVNGA